MLEEATLGYLIFPNTQPHIAHQSVFYLDPYRHWGNEDCWGENEAGKA